MRRPLVPVACGFALGILAAALAGFWVVPAVGLVCLGACWQPRWHGLRAGAIAALLGATWLLVRSPVWPGEYGVRQSQVIVQQVEPGDHYNHLTVTVRTLDGRAIPAWNPVRASIYTTAGSFIGEVLNEEIDWQPPEPPQNPGQFDYAAYQRRQGILATSWLTSQSPPTAPELTAGANRSLRATLVSRARQLPGAAGELLATLLLGEPAGDWSSDWRRAGLAHVLAVSGLHVGLILALVLAVLKLLRLPPRWRYALGATFLIAYGSLIGWRPAVWRAIIMALLGLLALATGRRRDWPSAMAAAALCLLVGNPWLLFDAGWQLSFAATWGVLAVGPGITARLPRLPWRLDSLLGISLAAQIATLPIVLYHFYLVTPLALFSNLLIVPALPLVLGLGVLYLVLIPASVVLAPLCAGALTALLTVAHWLGGLPLMSFSPGQPPLLFVALSMALLACMAWPRSPCPRPWLAVGWVVLIGLSLTWRPLCRFVINRYDFRVLAVGQGEASVLHLPGGAALLFDVGGASAQVGEQIIVPYLRHQGTWRVEGIYLSHLDQDHVIGLGAVLEAFPVQAIYLAEQFIRSDDWPELQEMADRCGVPLVTLEAGEELQAAALRITVLHPVTDLSRPLESNEDCLVLQLAWPNLKLLLPGDIGASSERQLLARLHTPVDVLLVAHHGSANSSDERFLSAIRPTLSIISTGPNRYGHPAAAAVERLTRNSGSVLRTDQAGAVLVWTNLRSRGLATWSGP